MGGGTTHHTKPKKQKRSRVCVCVHKDEAWEAGDGGWMGAGRGRARTQGTGHAHASSCLAHVLLPATASQLSCAYARLPCPGTPGPKHRVPTSGSITCHSNANAIHHFM